MLTVVLLAAFAPTPAFASRHVLDPNLQIGTPCAASPCGPGELSEPSGVAVNEATGNVYVVDKGNNRVEIFSPSGLYLGFFDGSGESKFEGTSNTGTPAGGNGGAEEFPSGRFEQPQGIAVDNSCTLHDPPLSELTTPTCSQFDPSYGAVYVTDARPAENAEPNPGEVVVSNQPVVDKFNPSGEYLGQITRNETHEEFAAKGFAQIFGVAVDPGGGVWVEGQNRGGTPNEAVHYDGSPAHTRLGAFITDTGESASASTGLAVDSEDNLYVHNTFGSGDILAKFASDGILIDPTFGEALPTDVAVEQTTDDVYIDHAGNWEHLDPEGDQLESLEVPGGGGTGIGVDASTPRGSTVYVADSSTGLVYVYTPEQPGAPTIEGSSVSKVTADSAMLEGEVDPHSQSGEEPTSWRFEFGACQSILNCSATGFEGSVPVPDGTLPPSFEAASVQTTLTGLAPATVYHFRLAAHNSHLAPGVYVHGAEGTFTAQGTSTGTGLPDGRGWELVSPADKHGALLLPISNGVIQASVSGGALTYLANGPTEAEPAGSPAVTIQVLSARNGPADSPWSSRDIASPHSGPAGVEPGTGNVEYRFFSPDLSRALVQPGGTFTPLSSAATEPTPYLRTSFSPAGSGSFCATSCYEPLVTAANVPVGTHFGGAGCAFCGPVAVGSSPDASQVVLRSETPLTVDAPPGEGSGSQSLYEWSAGRLSLVSVLPDGSPASSGSRPVLGYLNEVLGRSNLRHAISTDGSRVVFMESQGEGHLFLRDTVAGPAGKTVRLDEPQAGASGVGKVEPIFQDAATDGSRIFFTDTQQLVEGASGSGADLYECRVTTGPAGLGCALTDLTAQGGGEPARVIGLLDGASADGSTVYFTANGALTSAANVHEEVAVPGDCLGVTRGVDPEAQTVPQRCNLYERRGGRTRLVAVLSGADFPDWSIAKGLGRLTARISPSGRYLAFMSRRSLTGYDNRDAVTGAPDQEVYLYDSSGAGGEGRLICASCNPSGARPHGLLYGRLNVQKGGIAGGSEVWPETAGIAANIPGWDSVNPAGGEALYQSRYLSDQGRLIFNSADALVPDDTNGNVDVYEYEPPGGLGEPASDSCATSSSTFSSTSGGCVGLISSGTSSEESAFLDASESGDDIFFLTAAQLSRRDEDTTLDVYDARVGGGEEPATKAAECTGEACQQSGISPDSATPGSLTFSGPENQKECAKGKQLKKGKCVAKKAKKHHKKKNGKHKKSKAKKQKRANSKGGGHK